VSASLINIGGFSISSSNSAALSIKNANNQQILSVDTAGNAVLSGTLTTSGGNYDLAEDYATIDQTMEAGDVVSVDGNKDNMISKSTGAYDTSVIGVYSEKPGFKLSQINSTIAGNRAIPVALAGRVPVKVNAENGIVKKGDYLTASSVRGVAMKATKPGQIIGKALEDSVCTVTGCTEKVMTFINVSYADPAHVLSNIKTDENGNVLVSNISTSQIALPASIQIGSEEVNGTLTTALTKIADHLTTNESQLSVLTTNVMDVVSTVTSLSNRLNTVEAKEASNSTKLAATIDQTSSLSAQVSKLQGLIASMSATPATTSVNLGQAMPFTASTAAELGLMNFNANIATISGTLNVLGRTTVNDLGVTGTFSAGFLSIHGLNDDGTASINTSIGDLKLQDNSLGGINILSGKIIITNAGNVAIQNSLSAKEITTGKLNITADTISSVSGVLSASAGDEVVAAGTNAITIKTTAVTAKSLIFVTFNGDYSPATRYWIENKTAGKSFTIKLDAKVAQDAKFNWWIVN
jgi:hypothetical protein